MITDADDQEPVYSTVNLDLPDITTAEVVQVHSEAPHQPFLRQKPIPVHSKRSTKNSSNGEATSSSTAKQPADSSSKCFSFTVIMIAFMSCCCCCVVVPALIISLIRRAVNATHCVNAPLKYGDTQTYSMNFTSGTLVTEIYFEGFGDYQFYRSQYPSIQINESRKSNSESGFKSIVTSLSKVKNGRLTVTSKIKSEDESDCYSSIKNIYIPDGYNVNIKTQSGSVRSTSQQLQFASLEITGATDVQLKNVVSEQNLKIDVQGTVSLTDVESKMLFVDTLGDITYDTIKAHGIYLQGGTLTKITGNTADLSSDSDSASQFIASTTSGDQQHQHIIHGHTIELSSGTGKIVLDLFSTDFTGNFTLSSSGSVQFNDKHTTQDISVQYSTKQRNIISGTIADSTSTSPEGHLTISSRKGVVVNLLDN
jgi:hypothetical protein